MFRLLAAAIFLGLAAPAAAQLMQSEGETFLGFVRDENAGKALPLLEQPGSRLANFKGVEGETAMHIVARKKSLPWMATLLDHGANVNVTDKDGNTPLLIATQLGWYEGAETLLRVGANVSTANRRGETPLIRAVLVRNPRLVRLYMENGANPDQADFSAGLTARDYARRDTRHPELLELIEGTQASKGELKFGPIIELP